MSGHGFRFGIWINAKQDWARTELGSPFRVATIDEAHGLLDILHLVDDTNADRRNSGYIAYVPPEECGERCQWCDPNIEPPHQGGCVCLDCNTPDGERYDFAENH
jgi:hypothetical protein